MRKSMISFVCLLALSLMAIPAGAQTRGRRNSNSVYGGQYSQRTSLRDEVGNRDSRYRNNVSDNYRYGRARSFWEEHRDKITTAGGAAAGAVLGSLVGGKRGSIIGAVAGGGGAALYTYKIRDKSFRP